MYNFNQDEVEIISNEAVIKIDQTVKRHIIQIYKKYLILSALVAVAALILFLLYLIKASNQGFDILNTIMIFTGLSVAFLSAINIIKIRLKLKYFSDSVKINNNAFYLNDTEFELENIQKLEYTNFKHSNHGITLRLFLTNDTKIIIIWLPDLKIHIYKTFFKTLFKILDNKNITHYNKRAAIISI